MRGQALQPSRLLQMSDLGLQQANPNLFLADLHLDFGDLVALAAGEGLAQIDGQHDRHQQADPHQIDDPKAAEPPVENPRHA